MTTAKRYTIEFEPDQALLNPYLGLSPAERKNLFGFGAQPSRPVKVRGVKKKPSIETFYPPKGSLKRARPETKTQQQTEQYAGWRITRVAPGVFVSSFDPGTELESAAQWHKLIDSWGRDKKKRKYNPMKKGHIMIPARMNRGKIEYQSNVAAGFYDEDGQFHPLRGSFDYDPARVGEKAKPKRKKLR